MVVLKNFEKERQREKKKSGEGIFQIFSIPYLIESQRVSLCSCHGGIHYFNPGLQSSKKTHVAFHLEGGTWPTHSAVSFKGVTRMMSRGSAPLMWFWQLLQITSLMSGFLLFFPESSRNYIQGGICIGLYQKMPVLLRATQKATSHLLSSAMTVQASKVKKKKNIMYYVPSLKAAMATPLWRVQDAIGPSSPQLPSFAFPWKKSKEWALCTHTQGWWQISWLLSQRGKLAVSFPQSREATIWELQLTSTTNETQHWLKVTKIGLKDLN